MRIIDRIDINYFRSVYSISLNNCRDVNVITGSNDSGKSNILKALNLFFNQEIESNNDFDFLRDLNRDREDEARLLKGRMTIWIKVYFNNFLNWKSLPEQFAVKRTWNRYDDRAVDSYPDNIPATTMGRFLNKIRYHYIPAIRSRDIFSDLLADLHDILIEDEDGGLRDSSDALVENLHAQTSSMNSEILQHLKIDSTINIPESLRDLFRALDFSTKFGGRDVPLALRGDGIQSRHLPFILNYIASKSSQHHIWGYEEPENSLELTKSFEMAKDFRKTFSKENQIFLTTHSPAFYDISGTRSAKWYIENRLENERCSSHVQPIINTGAVDKTMGLLALITPRMKKVYEDHEELKESISEMQTKLELAESAVIYVEGPTDQAIFNKAKDVLGFGNLNCRFESANGAGDITQFLKVSMRVKSDEKPLLGLFDADARGRREFDIFKIHHKLSNTELRIIDKTKKIFVGCLQLPAHLEAANSAFGSIGMPIPLPIEFMFTKSVIDQAIEEDVLILKPRLAKISNEELPLEVNVEDIVKGKIEDKFIYLTKVVDNSCKTEFSQWISHQNPQTFEPFRSTFEQIALALSS